MLWALASEIRSLANLRQGLDDGQPLPGLLKAERLRRAPQAGRAARLPCLAGATLRTADLARGED